MSSISELVRLSHAESATLRITVESGETRVSYKRPRQRAVVVAGGPAEQTFEILLERLGYTGTLTNARFVEKMNPAQLQRCRELVGELQQLRQEVQNPLSASAYEPRLAPPRSSLHPQIVQGAPERHPDAKVHWRSGLGSVRRRRKRGLRSEVE